MSDERRPWVRQGEAFWRAHHEAWKRSDLNQRQYCASHDLPQKAFENWRQKFRLEWDPPPRRLLYRRRGLSHTPSHTLSHGLSHTLSHVTYPSSRSEGPIVPRPREGHRRRFDEADKRRILAGLNGSLLKSRLAANSPMAIHYIFPAGTPFAALWTMDASKSIPTLLSERSGLSPSIAKTTCLPALTAAPTVGRPSALS